MYGMVWYGMVPYHTASHNEPVWLVIMTFSFVAVIRIYVWLPNSSSADACECVIQPLQLTTRRHYPTSYIRVLSSACVKSGESATPIQLTPWLPLHPSPNPLLWLSPTLALGSTAFSCGVFSTRDGSSWAKLSPGLRRLISSNRMVSSKRLRTTFTVSTLPDVCLPALSSFR